MKCNVYPLIELTFFSILFSAGRNPRDQSTDWISHDYFEGRHTPTLAVLPTSNAGASVESNEASNR